MAKNPREQRAHAEPRQVAAAVRRHARRCRRAECRSRRSWRSRSARRSRARRTARSSTSCTRRSSLTNATNSLATSLVPSRSAIGRDVRRRHAHQERDRREDPREDLRQRQPGQIEPSRKSNSAMNARNAISIAADVEGQHACRRDAPPAGRVDDVDVQLLDVDARPCRIVSGCSSPAAAVLDRYSPHGAAMTLVVRMATARRRRARCRRPSRRRRCVAMPPTIIASSSDCVMRGTNGLTMSGASV